LTPEVKSIIVAALKKVRERKERKEGAKVAGAIAFSELSQYKRVMQRWGIPIQEGNAEIGIGTIFVQEGSGRTKASCLGGDSSRSRELDRRSL
jgi:hypothetical protein